MPQIIISEPARRDITEILIWSLEQFGDIAAERYGALIATAFDQLQTVPSPIGSRTHPDIPEGYRMLHLKHCTEAARIPSGIVKAPRHFVVYRAVPGDNLEIVRVLHDSMDFQRRL